MGEGVQSNGDMVCHISAEAPFRVSVYVAAKDKIIQYSVKNKMFRHSTTKGVVAPWSKVKVAMEARYISYILYIFTDS